MKKLNVTESNFQEIREALKARNVVRVNDTITLVSFIANTETVSATTGKKTRTPFYYVAENGAKYSSTTLKEKLGLTPETKGERKATTFASVWEQAKGLAQKASSEELKEAIWHLQGILDAREEEERAKAEVERKKQEALAKLSAEERALLGL